jgi:two-component system, sensor histidine kinase LadS
MKKRILWLLVVMCFAVATSSFCQPGNARYFLYEDSSLNITAEKALNLFQQNLFTENNSHHYNPGFTKSIFWLAIKLDTIQKPDSLTLVIGNAHINKIEFYQVNNEIPSVQYISGDYLKFSERPVATPKFSFPLSENTYLYLVKIDKHNESLQLTFGILSDKALTFQESKNAIITGILTGIIFLLLIFGFYLSIITTDKVYILYVLYVASGWLWVLSDMGYGFQYLWPDNTWFASRARPVFSELTIILSIQFCIYYIGGIKRKSLRNALNVTTVFASLLLLLWLMPLNVYDAPTLALVLLKIIPAVAAVYVFLGLTALIWEALRRNKMALFYLGALIPLMLMVFINILNHSGIINIAGSSLEQYGVAVGYVCEVIILTFGLVSRFNRYRIEKEQLQLAYEVQQKENAKALIDTEAKERKKIADELHDIAGSMLSAAKLNISSIRETNAILDNDTQLKLEKTEEALNVVAASVRNLSHALSPIMLHKIGFKKSIQNVADFYTSSGKLRIEVVVLGFEKFDPALENIYSVLYSITYELLNNIAKHANASEAIIQLIEHEETIIMQVEDNGKGLISEFDKQNTKGLSGINSKINYFNGKIEFDNTPTGLAIMIEIPKTHEKTGNIS